MTPEANQELLQQAVAGDAAALRTLLKQYGPLARNSIRGKIDPKWRSVLEEDDVMQVTYLEAFLHLDQLAARDIDGFVAWLSRIAQNVLRDALRGLMRQKRPQPGRRVGQAAASDESYAALIELLGTTSSTPSRHAVQSEANRELESALAELPPDYGRVVRLYDLEGRPAGEVASELGRSVGAVLMLRSRALQHLRRLMGSPSRFFSESGEAGEHPSS